MLEADTVADVQDVQEAVRALPVVRVRAGCSKGALSGGANLDLSGLSGVLEYDPQEYTFTALAGTPIREVEAMLNEHGQYLPFDPPFPAQATLAGTVAAGLSGPGRYRYGGVRDFLLGVRFVDGSGRIVTGGAKVVKNAAGFDFPKLMVGSLGRFGVMLELTFKVFPRPEAYATLRLELPGFEHAEALLARLAAASYELSALEFDPPGTLYLRLGGSPEALAERLARVQADFGAGEALTGDAERTFWEGARSFEWCPPDAALVKVALSPKRMGALEAALAHVKPPRRYGVGGNVLYLAWSDALGDLSALLSGLGLPGLALSGAWDRPYLGAGHHNAFEARIASVLDPQGKMGERRAA